MYDHTRPPRHRFKQSSAPRLDQIQDSASDKIDSQPFVPPELAEPIETIDLGTEPKNNHTATSLKKLLNKKTAIITAIAAIVLIAGGSIYWFVFHKNNTPKNSTAAVVTVVKKGVKSQPTSPLTGATLTDASLANRPVTGLMIENSPDARPQSGLTDAGVVFEAIAEGGITRFLALFQESQPQYIGPIRSARPYYIDFALGFDASYGHVGGSPDAMSDIQSLGVKNLDQFYNSQAYWRVTDRYAPHNVYTSFAKLDALNQSKGYTSSHFTPFERKKDVPQTPTASSIDFSISGPLYSPHFQYDPATNTYKRFEGGQPHVDQKSGAQISPKVVIALVMSQSLMSDGDHTVYGDVGSGKMYVFQDGIVSEGTWSKADRKSQFIFTDKNGLPMKLNAGQTWISIVGDASYVSYKA